MEVLRALLLVAIVSASLAWSSALPPLVFHATIRDFLPAGCMTLGSVFHYWPNYSASGEFIGNPAYCPLYGDINNQRFSGHPDFELLSGFAYGTSGGAVTNLTSYGKGIASSGNFLSATVEPVLSFHLDGLPKPVYCNSSLRNPAKKTSDPRCGWSGSMPFSSGPNTFQSWYRDTQLYNLRSGVVIVAPYDLISAQYKYSSPPPVNASMGFHPLDVFAKCTGSANGTLACGKGARVWPLAKKLEVDERALNHTWSFTTEIHTFFAYTGVNQTFMFTGDDDVWIYINEKLAVDMGGMHNQASGQIDLCDEFVAQTLGLQVGGVYALDMYHAERHSWGSNFAFSTSLSSGCTALLVGEAAYAWNPSLLLSDWKLVGAAPSLDGSAIIMAWPNVPSLATYAFLRQRINVASGFVVSFNFVASARGHGFVLGLVSDSIDNLNGGSGANLGFRNMGPSWALAFDFCLDDGVLACNSGLEVRMHYVNGSSFDGRSNGSSSSSGSSSSNNNNNSVTSDATCAVRAPLTFPNLVNDGAMHSVEVRYYAKWPPWIDVVIDNDLFLQRRGIDLTQVLGSSSSSGSQAYVGFTASTGVRAEEASLIQVSSVQVTTVAINDAATRVVYGPPALGSLAVADGKQTAVVVLQTYDLCGRPLEFGGYALRARGSLQSQISVPATVVDAGDGTYLLKFTSTLPGNFTAQVGFGADCSAAGPQCFSTTVEVEFAAATASPSVSPTTSAATVRQLPTWLFIAAGVGGSCIFLACFGVCLCTRRYRDAWRRDKAFIAAGQAAALDRGVDFMGDDVLDELQARLQATLEALNRERARKGSRAAIEALLRSQGELAEQVRLLKERRARRLAPTEASAPGPGAKQRSSRAEWKRLSFVGARVSTKAAAEPSMSRLDESDECPSSPARYLAQV